MKTYQVEIRELSCGGNIFYKAFVFTTKGVKKFGGYRGMSKEQLQSELSLAGYDLSSNTSD